MSLSTWIGIFRSNRKSRRRSRRPSAPRKRLSFHSGGAFGIECLERRALLTAIVVDRSSDPSADTIDVGTSGSNTVISVNGANLYNVPSASISSLSITGTAYNDTISFDFTGGNPVPDGTMSVNGGGGADTLAASAGSDFNLGGTGLGVGSSLIATANVQNATLTAGADTSDIKVDGWAGDATVNCMSTTTADLYALPSATGNSFFAHPSSAVLYGPGYSYTASGYRDINGYGNGEGDTAGIDDQGSPGNAELVPNGASAIQGDGYGYLIEASSFGHVDAQSYYASDTAHMDFANAGYMYPTYSYDTAWQNGSNGEYSALFTAVGYSSVEMTSEIGPGASASVDMDDDGSSGTAYTHPASTTLQGPGYSNVADGFASATVTSYNSADVAYMDDNGATGGSSYISYPGYSYWQGNTSSGAYRTQETGFKTVNSVAFNNANDSAFVNDNAGAAYMSANNDVQMQYGNGTVIGLTNFGGYDNWHISAYATLPQGQYDTAQSALKPYVVFYGNWTFV